MKESQKIVTLDAIDSYPLGVFLLRREAQAIGMRLETEMHAQVFQPWLCPEMSAKEQFAHCFRSCKKWVMVMPNGIAVRFVCDLLHSKYVDPAVVVLDEGCNYAVSLIGGHERGGNELAFAVANLFAAAPVVTTATEVLKPLIIGIGCRKHTASRNIEEAVFRAIEGRQISEVRCVATIDLKKDEPGLVEFCLSYGLPLRVFSRHAVAARPWVIEPSQWVREVTGAVGVCEPCALMASTRGQLIKSKFALNGVAVAVVEDKWEAGI